MKERTFYQLLVFILLIMFVIATFTRESDYTTFDFENNQNITIENVHIFNKTDTCDCMCEYPSFWDTKFVYVSKNGTV